MLRTSIPAAVLVVLLAGGVSACAAHQSGDSDSPPAPALDVAADDAANDAGASQAPKPAKVKMPAVKGKNLQVIVSRLERKGFTDIEPLPVDGHAFAANYANWVIVRQDPAAGKWVSTDTLVTLEVKKTDEAENSVCIDGDC
jgi:hypothetical protein